MDVRAVAVVDGTTLAIGPAGHAAERRGQLPPGLQLVPAEPVEHEEHHLVGLERGRGEPGRSFRSRLEQSRDHVRDARPAVVGDDRMIPHALPFPHPFPRRPFRPGHPPYPPRTGRREVGPVR